MIIFESREIKLLVAEGLMYDPGLIKCAEFDWFSVQCLEDTLSFTSQNTTLPFFSMFQFVPSGFFRRYLRERKRKLKLYGGPTLC